MYYKNKQNQPYYDPSNEVILKDGLVEITGEEFNQIVVQINTPSSEQLLEQQIQEARQYLNLTDWYYARKLETGEDVPEEVLTKRLEYRELIRLQGVN